MSRLPPFPRRSQFKLLMPPQEIPENAGHWRRRAVAYSEMLETSQQELHRMEIRSLFQIVFFFVVGLVVGWLCK